MERRTLNPLCFAMLLALPGSAQLINVPPRQPRFTADKVQPANSDRAYPLPPGSFVSIYGSGLGPEDSCSGRPDPKRPEKRPTAYETLPIYGDLWEYPRELCGVQVFVNGVAADLLYVQANQINFKVPQQTVAGTAQLRVLYDGIYSETVPITIAAPFIDISVEGPAVVGMPIWLKLTFGGRPIAEYPVGSNPAGLGCADIEVRKDGKLLPKIPEIQEMDEGIYSGPGCGVISLPGKPMKGMLPLHLLYRFSERGDYEVRYISKSRYWLPQPPGIPGQGAGAQSEWTTIHVQPAAKGQRAQWLVEMAANAPPDPGELLSDYLPNVLGIPDDPSLAIVKQYLYHPNELVRRYAMHGMHYWPETEIQKAALELLKSKGPSDVIANVLTRESVNVQKADALAEEAIKYLNSESPTLVRGAISLIRNLSIPGRSNPSAAVRARVESALVSAYRPILATGDNQLMVDYSSVLGMMRSAATHATLWRLAIQPVTREQALLALTWRKVPEDLPRLGKILVEGASADLEDRRLSNLPGALFRAYGQDALPYLETAIHSSPNRWVRYDCADVLIRQRRAAGFAVALEAIQNDPPNKWHFIELLKGQFPELRDADEAAIVSFLRNHIQ